MKELEDEQSKLRELISLKTRDIETLKKKVENRDILGEISKAGNADGKVEMLTEKWIICCQEVLQALQISARTPTSLGQLLAYFQIEPTMLRYNQEDDSFC